VSGFATTRSLATKTCSERQIAILKRTTTSGFEPLYTALQPTNDGALEAQLQTLCGRDRKSAENSERAREMMTG
jgi:hypothetical protein